MNIVVFGAAGWLGRAVLANLKGRHRVRAFDRDPRAWDRLRHLDGEWAGDETAHGDIADLQAVEQAVSGMDAALHLAVYFGRPDAPNDDAPFLINLKGLWNVLQSAQRHHLRRVVHVGSCPAVHPRGIFFEADVRRPDGHLYAVCKRLQEEMCRQYHEAYGLSIVVLRPDYIVDSRLGLGHLLQPLGGPGQRTRNGWVCRHDLAEACRLAVESETICFDILHIVGTPEADETCNVARARQVLGLTLRGDLDQYR